MRVPEGWRVISLGKHVMKVGSGVTPTGGSASYQSFGIPLIRSQNVLWGRLSLNDIAFIDDKQHKKMSGSIVRPGDVLLNITGASIGRSCVVSAEIKEANVNQHVCIIRTKPEISPNYLLFFLLSFLGQKQIDQFQAGGNRQGLNFEQIRSFKIPLPPYSEQQKIAQILSTWDKAIEKLESLIAAKQKRKQALMQQLLTGKQRFSGFKKGGFSVRKGFAKSKLGKLPNDWLLEPIKNFFWYQEGPGVRKHQFTGSGVKLLNGTNIQNSKIILSNTVTYISEKEAYGAYAHFQAEEGDLVIACSGISVDKFDEKIAFLDKSHLPLCMNTSTMRFKTLDAQKANIEYFKYFMMSRLFKNQVRGQITGSAQLNFGPSHIGKCFVVLPSIEEQQKIAAFLSVADKEIAIHQNQLAALKQQKNALMQQLLTGKKLVNVGEVE